MSLNQRQVTLLLIGGMATVGLVLALNYAVVYLANPAAEGATTSGYAVLSSGLVALLCGLLCWLYWRGWEPARYITTVLIALAVVAGLSPSEPNVAVVLPVVFALAVANWRWVAGVGALVPLALVFRGAIMDPGAPSAYAGIATLSSYIPIVGAAVLGSYSLENARSAAERSARQAEAERALAERRAEELGRQTAELNAQNNRQRELLELVSSLETPAVSVAEGVLLAPVVGNLDSRRAEQLTRRLLESVHVQRVNMVILDIAGVPVVDTAVAAALTNTVQALRLLGCEVVLTGISATVAITLTTIGAGLQNLAVAASPQEALARLGNKGT